MGAVDRDLAAGQLHADADAGVALAAARSAAPASAARTSSSASSTCSTGRSSASTWRCSRFVDRPPLDRRAGGGRRRWARACRWSRRCPRASCPRTTRRSSRSSVRTPEGTSLAATQIAAERIAREVRDWPEVIDHAAHHRRQPAEDAQPGVDLRAPGAARPAQAHAGPAAGPGPQRDRPQAAQGLPDQRVGRWRRSARGTFSTATVQYILSGPGPRPAHAVLRRDRQEAEGDPGRRRRRHHRS